MTKSRTNPMDSIFKSIETKELIEELLNRSVTADLPLSEKEMTQFLKAYRHYENLMLERLIKKAS